MTRFKGLLTVGELQAMVTAFAVAGAYNREPPFNNPTWYGIAEEAQRALKEAVDSEPA